MRNQRTDTASSARSILSLRAHSSTRRSFSRETPPRPLSTRSTVASLTSAALAISAMLVLRGLVFMGLSIIEFGGTHDRWTAENHPHRYVAAVCIVVLAPSRGT